MRGEPGAQRRGVVLQSRNARSRLGVQIGFYWQGVRRPVALQDGMCGGFQFLGLPHEIRKARIAVEQLNRRAAKKNPLRLRASAVKK